jgi:hypothetical protein
MKTFPIVIKVTLSEQPTGCKDGVTSTEPDPAAQLVHLREFARDMANEDHELARTQCKLLAAEVEALGRRLEDPDDPFTVTTLMSAQEFLGQIRDSVAARNAARQIAKVTP